MNKTKNFQPVFLFLTYFIIGITVLLTFKDYGVHIEEKFHRMNGLYWLNYISQVFNFEKISLITDIKMKEISDYTLSSVKHYNKYGAIFDLPAAYIEVLFNIKNIENIYYLKHLLSFTIFLISSFFFYKILLQRFNNFFLSISGTLIFITTPRIFGDSFFYKDVLFLSFFNIALYFLLKLLENLNFKNILYFSIFSAMAFNLRVFALFLPITFLILLIIKSLNDKKIYNYLKIYFFYLFIFISLIICFSPYLWSSPLNNLLEIFLSLKKDLIGSNIKILFNGEFINNRILPDSYLPVWIFISTPIITLTFFLLGYFFYLKRFINRFIKIKEKQIFPDLWRGQREQKDFILFFILTSFLFAVLFFNSPFYNGWRLVYFLNIFIVYFAIYQINNFIILNKRYALKKKLIIFIILFLITHNVVSLITYHPYQSYYFNELLSDKSKNSFEGDYHGISGKHFFLKLISENKDKKIKVAVASYTPLHRSFESLNLKLVRNFEVIGQDYKNADYIYKNNISEVNSYLNKKYNIPNNFVKIYELNIDGLIIYEIFKNIK
jgi:hypothetical protein|tara:strand:- start:8451 stop:10103 length:1653 start_codon:yes stop_codon:yes gene_type:complete